MSLNPSGTEWIYVVSEEDDIMYLKLLLLKNVNLGNSKYYLKKCFTVTFIKKYPRYNTYDQRDNVIK